MKQLLTLCIAFISIMSFGQGPQAWPEAFHQEDVDIIMNEIATPMVDGEIDKVLARTTFPFEAGEKKFTKAQLKAVFTTYFTPEICAELKRGGSYEVMNPDGDAYMMVTRGTPEGYDGAVVVFQRRNGIWMLDSMSLFTEEDY